MTLDCGVLEYVLTDEHRHLFGLQADVARMHRVVQFVEAGRHDYPCYRQAVLGWASATASFNPSLIGALMGTTFIGRHKGLALYGATKEQAETCRHRGHVSSLIHQELSSRWRRADACGMIGFYDEIFSKSAKECVMKLKPIRSLIAGMSFAVAMTLNPVQAHMTGMQQQGMMGPGMMGPGMMGPGMMGPGMMGPGMMGGMGQGPGAILNLDEAQQEKLANLQQSQAKQQWQLMQQLVQQQNELAKLSSAENPDTQAVGAAYDKLANLQKQMFLNNLEAQKQFQALLTDEQRKTLQQMRQMGWGAW